MGYLLQPSSDLFTYFFYTDYGLGNLKKYVQNMIHWDIYTFLFKTVDCRILLYRYFATYIVLNYFNNNSVWENLILCPSHVRDRIVRTPGSFRVQWFELGFNVRGRGCFRFYPSLGMNHTSYTHWLNSPASFGSEISK